MSFEYQVVCDIPIAQKEAVVKNEDDCYTIFLRPDLDPIAQREAFAHAIRHIINDDFYREDGDVQGIEMEAHYGA